MGSGEEGRRGGREEREKEGREEEGEGDLYQVMVDFWGWGGS